MNNSETFHSLSEIEEIITRFGQILNANKSDLPSLGFSIDFAYPHIEVDNDGYHFVITERGHEIHRKSTKNFEDFLYRIFENITSSMAMQYEFENRIEGIDHRRTYFSKQEELMGKVNPVWLGTIKNEHNTILSKNPFDDYADKRVQLCEKYLAEGNSEDVAWEQACKEFPLPGTGRDA